MKRGLLMAAALAAMCGVSSMTRADTTTWTGAEDTNWNNSDNWTNGVPDASGDFADAAISLTSGGPVISGTGTPTAGAVTLTTTGDGLLSVGVLGGSNTPVTFSSIEVIPNGLARRVFIGANTTLTLTGNGDVLKVHATNNTEAAVIGAVSTGTAPTLAFAGDNLTFGTAMTGDVTAITFGNPATANVGNLRLMFTAPDASIDFGGKNLVMYGSGGGSGSVLQLDGSQTWTNLPMINFGNTSANTMASTSLTNSNSDPIANPLSLANTVVRWQNGEANSRDMNLAGGTFKAIVYEMRRNGANTHTLQLQGDVTTVGSDFNGFGLETITNNASAIARLNLNGKLFHVSHASATPSIGASGEVGTSILDLNGGEFRTANTLTIHSRASVQGAGTLTVNGGRLVNNSTRTINIDGALNSARWMDLTAVTIALGNAATGIDWNSGSIDVGAGLSSADFTAANFAIGNLALGNGTYTLAGGDEHDLLIDGLLTIALGGVLDLGDWSSVSGIEGGQVQTLAFNGLDQVSTVQAYLNAGQITASGLNDLWTLGIINGSDDQSFYIGVVLIPEPATLGLLALGGLLMLSRRKMTAL